MRSSTLVGRKVAILATDGFEESELTRPREALEQAGAEVTLISLEKGQIRGWKDKDWGDHVAVDLPITAVRPEDYDALLLPGGVANPDKLRMSEDMVRFAEHFATTGKPIAAICHGPWLLIETGMVKGRTLTSWPSLKTDLTNAGANWVDEKVVVDRGLVTSRKPDDIPAFVDKMVEEFAEGIHASGLSRSQDLNTSSPTERRLKA